MGDGRLRAACVYVERMSIIGEKLHEVGIAKLGHKTNLHILHCLSPDYEVDKTMRLHAPNLILTMIEDRVRTTFRELERKRKTVDSSANALVVTGCDGPIGHGIFPTPGHDMGGGGDSTRSGVGHWEAGQQRHQQQQQHDWAAGKKQR